MTDDERFYIDVVSSKISDQRLVSGESVTVVPTAVMLRSGNVHHLVVCPDAITLINALNQRRPYAALNQLIRATEAAPSRSPGRMAGGKPDAKSQGSRIDVQVAWTGSARLIARPTVAQFDAQVDKLVAVTAGFLRTSGEERLSEAVLQLGTRV